MLGLKESLFGVLQKENGGHNFEGFFPPVRYQIFSPCGKYHPSTGVASANVVWTHFLMISLPSLLKFITSLTPILQAHTIRPFPNHHPDL